MAPVLKTGELQGSVGSNPTPSATLEVLMFNRLHGQQAYKDVRWVEILDFSSNKENEKDREWIATRPHSNYQWTHCKSIRISSNEEILKLITRRTKLLEEQERDDYYEKALVEFQKYNCNVTGLHPCKTFDYTVNPSKDGGLWLGPDDRLSTIRDDQLMHFYLQGQRQMQLRLKQISIIENLLTIAAKDRLPKLEQNTKKTIQQVANVNLLGLNMFFNIEFIYSHSNTYINAWHLVYMMDQYQVKLIEVI